MHLFYYYCSKLLAMLLEVLSWNKECEILNSYCSPWSSIKNKSWMIGKSLKIIGELNFLMSLCHKMGQKRIISHGKRIVQNQPSLHSTKGVSAWKWGLMPGGKDLGRVVSSLPCWRKLVHYISCMSEQRNLNKVNAMYQILFLVK